MDVVKAASGLITVSIIVEAMAGHWSVQFHTRLSLSFNFIFVKSKFKAREREGLGSQDMC